jgi:hypothetical protein
VRWTVIAGTALALLGLALPAAAGARTATPPDPYELGQPTVPRASAAQAPTPSPATAGLPGSFTDALTRLLAAGSIPPATRQADLAAMVAARQSLRKLHGTRHTELAAVIGNLTRIATTGQLTPSRLPALVLTLERNRQWWTTGPLLSSEQRVTFPGSLLVWEYYPGQGIEIQWLASFGKANGYFLTGPADNAPLGQILDELVGLAVARAGGIAWEYDFSFDGGSPPWVSAISQGTAIQALARGAVRLGRPAYFDDARQALPIFETPPPLGVRLATPNGAWYLIYSFAPDQLVLNAFIQSLVGLYDFATLANDPTGRALFAAGDAEARIDVPHYDTGAWSLYDQSTESDLGYHELLDGFLRNLCNRTQDPAPSIAATIASAGTRAASLPGVAPSSGGSQAPAGESTTPASPAPLTGAAGPTSPAGATGPAGATSPAGTTGPVGATSPGVAGGTSPTPGAAPPPAPIPTPAPGPAAANIFCATATDFADDLHQPPTLALHVSGRLRAGATAHLHLTLSKISNVVLTAVRAARTTTSVREQLGHGTRTLSWTPTKPGRYKIAVTATDLAGNTGRTSIAVTVAAAATGHSGHA